MPLRSELVFVDQPAEEISTADALEIDYFGRFLVVRRRRPERRPLCESAVRPVLVVMRDVRGEDVLEMPATEDQQPL